MYHMEQANPGAEIETSMFSLISNSQLWIFRWEFITWSKFRVQEGKKKDQKGQLKNE